MRHRIGRPQASGGAALLVASAVALVPLSAGATSVYVVAIGVRDVQVVIDGLTARTLRVGEVSPEGVGVREIEGERARLEVDGRVIVLRSGQSAGSRATLVADARGHFVATALINGYPVDALIDTGATYVTLTAADALRMGIDYLRGTHQVSQTANGPVSAYVVNLARVQIGGIVLTAVPGLVLEGTVSQTSPALVGMSFLRGVEMRQNGGVMELLQRE
jgi:aspartyl protease family protein